MIKGIIFDLDGVLVDLKDAHYNALNSALAKIGREYIITLDQHYSQFDGLPTKKKLEMLTLDRGLPTDTYGYISSEKQKNTINYIYDNIEFNKTIYDTLKFYKELGYKLAVASNSIKNTIYTVLVKLKLIDLIDVVVSNNDVTHPKPHPEIYLSALVKLGLKPSECLIVEDSPYGIEAAENTCAYVMKVTDSKDININNINQHLNVAEKMSTNLKWDGRAKWNVLIPMSGAGSRFADAGYKFPKPIIEVNNKPMIQLVIENLNIDANYIYVVQREHYEKYNLKYILNLLTPNCTIVQTEGLTEGAACSTLLAKEYIDNNQHLLIANSDQFVEWDANRFYYTFEEDNTVDGGMLTFESVHSKWSFAKLDENGYITEVAEKKPISNIASTGIYFWKNGSDYVKFAESMISKNIRVNNEFYVCPVFNEAILSGKKLKTYDIDKMWGLGTPEDLGYFLNNFKINDKR